MCGRYTLIGKKKKLTEQFSIEEDRTDEKSLYSRYNISPGMGIPVIIDNKDTSARTLDIFHWGLVPEWAKDPNIGLKLTNARSETVSEKPSFREAYKHRRCLIPASGFYEWERRGAVRQPYYFTSPRSSYLAFAGLWEYWASDDGSEVLSATILTRPANKDMKAIHHRMPVVLEMCFWDEWMQGSIRSINQLLIEAMHEQDLNRLNSHPVKTEVNNARNDNEELIEVWIPPQDQQLRLF